MEYEAKIRICSFSNWLDACESVFDGYIKKSIALKCGSAYSRTLKFERVCMNEAEEDFNNILKTRYLSKFPFVKECGPASGKKLQDYMMHYMMDLANKRNVVIQFHTGLLGGNGNEIYNSDPASLTNLFLEYPDVVFDIFHIGYPYEHTLSALAKMFPNVFIDMCWSHIISPEACINILSEWIDTIPLNKICAFGGDYTFIDGVCGHLQLAKLNVSKALTKKIKDGTIDIDRSFEIAKLLFYENPMNIFKLNERRTYK